MIAVPVFTPGSDLKRSEPPNILAGIHSLRQPRLEVQDTVHGSLQMQAVSHAQSAEPEKTGPSKDEIPERHRHDNDKRLKFRPEQIARLDHVGRPFVHAGRRPLIQPSEMSPPEP